MGLNMKIDLRELRQMDAITREGSFAKAARVLHISQPALTRSIQELESKVGFKIFDRSREGTTLTEVGRSFMMEATDLLALADNLERDFSRVRSLEVGRLTLGVGVYASEMFVGEALSGFARQSTRLRIRLINDPPDVLMRRIQRRDVDMVVADPAWLALPSEVRVITLKAHQGYLVARPGHPIFAKRKPILSDILDSPFVTMGLVPDRLSQMGKRLKGKAASEQAVFENWAPSITTNSIATMKTIAAASDGIALVSLKMVEHELARGELAVLPFNLRWLQTSFAIMHLAHRALSPLSSALIEAMIAADKALLAKETLLAETCFLRS
jgi:DNA-binding transcriptional LysR family regulator